MPKSMDILLDPETGDLQLSAERNRFGLIEHWPVVGNAVYQHQAIILQASKGEFKEFPTLGVSLQDMTNDHDAAGWKREIVMQMEFAGMSVKGVDIDIIAKKLTVDAEYSS